MSPARLISILCAALIAITLLPSVAFADGLPAAAVPGGDASVVAQREPALPRTTQAPPAAERVIVKYRSGTSRAARRSLRESARATLLRNVAPVGAEVLRLASGADATAVARRLARRSDVLYAAPDVFRRVARNDPWYAQQWGLDNTGQTIVGAAGVAGVDSGAAAAWGTQTAAPGTVVAVVDTGVDIQHPDLADVIWTNPGEAGAVATNGVDDDANGYVDDVHGWDFANNDASVFDAADGDAHGTHVAGTIAASADNGVGGAGVAPGVQIMPLKFLGPAGGWDSDAIAAIAYAKAQGVKIVNASWGATNGDSAYAESAPLKDAIRMCGCVFVAAAGNSGRNNDNPAVASFPASFDLPNIVSVAAMRNTGALAGFSNYGSTSVDVAAPGVSILSTVPRQQPGVAAVHVSTAAYAAQHWGFGLEDIATAAKRADLLERALTALGTGLSSPILLVADDESDTIPGQSSYYTEALAALGYGDVTTVSVPTGADGPSAATMAGKTVIWETGLAYGSGSSGPLRANDREALTGFLDAGGRLILAGSDAIYRSESTTFVRNRLHVTFLREEAVRTQLAGVAAPYTGATYAASSADSHWGLQEGQANPYRDVVTPRSASAVAVLQYPGDVSYDTAYSYYDGTSMAAPHVAGVAALLLGRWPSLAGAALADRISVSARPLAGLVGKVSSGGFVQAVQAVGDAPSPPSAVGVRVLNGNLWVSWSRSPAPFDQLSSYDVQLVRNGVAGGWTAFAQPGEYALRDVPGDGTYAVRVRARGGGASLLPRQSASSVVMPVGSAPGPVSGLALTGTGGSGVLSWGAPAANGSGILTYEVCQPSAPCRTLSGTPGMAPPTSLSWTASPDGVSVRATNSYGTGAASRLQLPGTPVNLVGTAGDKSATVRWDVPNPGHPASSEAIVTVSPGGRQIAVSGTSVHVSGLTNATAYTFTVRVKNAAGLSAPAVSGTVIPRDVVAPEPPAALAVAAGTARASVNWRNEADADREGVVVRVAAGTAAPGPTEGIVVHRGEGTSAVALGLREGETYTVAAYSYDEAGNYSPAATAVVHGSTLARVTTATNVTYGTRVTHRALLMRPSLGRAVSGAVAGQVVQLVQRPRRSTAWTPVCSATTSSTGNVSCATAPRRNTEYQWRFAGAGQHGSARSTSYVVTVRARVTAQSSASTVRRRDAFRISGKLVGARAAQQVHLQRKTGTTWGNVARTALTADGSYRFRLRANSKGISAYRVSYRGDARLAGGVSPIRRIRVR